MSTPILPFAAWESGTNQNSIPANDNSLRNQILNGLVISDSTDAQPVSPADGDIYIITGAATGTQWATFDEFDLTIFDSGTWYAFAPVEGIIVNIAGAAYTWNGTAYVAVTTGSGGAATAPVVTLSGTTYTLDDLTNGSWHVFDNAGLVTITVMNDATEPVAANAEFGIDAKGAAGVTFVSDDLAVITPQPDSTLALAQHDFAVLKRRAADDYRLIGSTVAP